MTNKHHFASNLCMGYHGYWL